MPPVSLANGGEDGLPGSFGTLYTGQDLSNALADPILAAPN